MTRKPKPARVKVIFNWEGSLYSHPPGWKRAKILTQGELAALQARGYTVIIERYD